MGVNLSRKEIIRATKQQFIVDAANELFRESGIDHTNMVDIAIKANYTKRTLYSYFKSKDEIILWAFTDDLAHRWDYQKQQLKLQNTGLGKLKIWSHSLYDFYNKYPQSLQLQRYIDYKFVQKDKVNELIFKKFESINNDLAEGLRDIFKLGIDDGSFREDIEVDMTISQFLYSYRAILSRIFSSSYSFAKFNRSEYVNHFMKLFIRNIRKNQN